MKIFDKNELRILWPFYLEYFIASLLFLAPAFMTLYFYQMGLSFYQIGILLAIMPLARLLFEIPTGAFADLYGRKYSVLVGYFIEGMCVLSLFFVKEYSLLLMVFILWGIGGTFSSGSKDAWIVDLINKEDKKLVHNLFNKMQIFINLGLILSGFLGAMLVKYFGLSIIWIVTAFSFLASIILLTMFTKENYTKREVKIKDSLKNIIKQSCTTISYGYKHHVLFYYLIATFLIMIGLSFNGMISWTAFMKELNFQDSYFGYLWSLISFFTMIAPIVSSKLLKKGKEKNFIIISIAISAIIILFVLLSNTWMSALCILALFTFFFDLRSPASEIYFHRFIPSKLRATMGSMKALIVAIGGIIGYSLAGYLIDLIGARYTILIYVLFAVLVIILYLRIRDEKE